jgi:putative protease
MIPLNVYNGCGGHDPLDRENFDRELGEESGMTSGEQVGEVIHFYGKISVGVLRCTKPLKVGDKVHFLGRHTDFEQEIASMQVEHQAVDDVASGEEVAVKVKQRVRRGDKIYRL